MESTPIRALDKRLRDGRRATIDLVPEPGPSAETSFWMTCVIDGEVQGERYHATVDRAASGVLGLPHLISAGSGRTSIALSDDEADAIEAAKEEWYGRHLRERLQAAPEAPTRVLRGVPAPFPRPGAIISHAKRSVVVLEVLQKEWTTDGWSMGIAGEDGWLHDLRVRDLTEAEQAAEEAEQAAKRAVYAAWDEAMHVFGWAHWMRWPPDTAPFEAPSDATLVHDPNVEPAFPSLFLAHGCLTRAEDRYVTHVFGGSACYCGHVDHPATPERDRVWNVLDAARTVYDHVYYRELYL